ncbi:methylenetetrahydrofolate reductase [Chloroflexota bacterium]
MATPFKEVLKSGKFIVTSEVGPPKGTNLEKTLHHIDLLKDKVDALNATDNQSSVMRFPSLGLCQIIRERGGEPILQMTCRDRNRMALEADLLSASYNGINNVLCLTGDAISVGDHKQAKQVFDIESVQLLRTVRLMESGKDLGGNDLDGTVNFCAGAIVTPEAEPIEPQLLKFKKKVAAGAEFFQTQAVYDIDNLKSFMEYANKLSTKIIVGIVLLSSAGMARFMNNNVPGIFVPQNLIDEMAGAEKGKALQTGISIAGRMIKAIKEDSICHGVHIMAIGREDVVPDILDAAGIS